MDSKLSVRRVRILDKISSVQHNRFCRFAGVTHQPTHWILKPRKYSFLKQFYINVSLIYFRIITSTSDPRAEKSLWLESFNTCHFKTSPFFITIRKDPPHVVNISKCLETPVLYKWDVGHPLLKWANNILGIKSRTPHVKESVSP